MVIEAPSRMEHVGNRHSNSKNSGDFVIVGCLSSFDTNEDKKHVLGLMREFS